MRILLVEDDDRISKPLIEDLRHQHHVVDLAQDGIEGLAYAQARCYDLILLDLMLPKLDGISLCKKLRLDHYNGFILMITAKDMLSDKVLGLDAGADDYLVKPFELDELSARIRALSRRPVTLQESILKHGKLGLNVASRRVEYGDRPLNLTPKEYLILDCLMRSPQQVFTKIMLLDKLWEFDQSCGEETIKTHITNIRRKLKLAGSQQDLIETVYGVGYRMISLELIGE